MNYNFMNLPGEKADMAIFSCSFKNASSLGTVSVFSK
jgi:hypothetical protein